ncbi:MAG: hypothetical protein K2G65_04560, partial [Eubacterium sp.]|nr:hypothetical protein [Eubacterium sp.]
VYADEGDDTASAEPEPTVDASQPRLMVSSYKLDSEYITPDSDSIIEIVFKNYSDTKAISNIKLSLTEESGEIKPSGTGTEYVSRIYAGSSYTWKTKLKASKIAAIGEHRLTVTAEYEDKYYNAYSASDTLLVNVSQSVGLDYSGVVLPRKVTQENTVTMDVNLMNTGKCMVRNSKLNFDIDGLETGSVLFIGEIAAGESKTGSANFRISSDKLGEVKGKATLEYEDEFGNSYSKEIDISTVIEKKPEAKEEAEEEDTFNTKYPKWWAFLIAGAAAGGIVGFAVPTAIRSKKQRKEDELRL